ncbi:hypothetical protein [Isoptericola croceus]|uniref:hypothetical protein n=1 Tax=Isoptericola croceus TaxID=3031406 RepID=UPI0023F8BC82|nr:hypothetical protein [Isoptericola croceus]
MTTPDHHDDGAPPPAGDPAFDPAETLRIIEESQQRARKGIEVDGRLLYLVWGLAWGIGYLVLWTSARDQGGPPTGPAFPIFGTLLIAAIVITIVHSVRRGSGTRGPSRRAGAMYGWSWMLGFLAYPFIIAGIARAGASEEVIALVANALACVVVGLMYLAGGTFFPDNRLFVLGLWILLTGGVATVAGMPGTYLVMAIAGGGGFLVMCGIEAVLTARRRRTAACEPGARDVVGQEPVDG